jgi:hypothetical protein
VARKYAFNPRKVRFLPLGPVHLFLHRIRPVVRLPLRYSFRCQIARETGCSTIRDDLQSR